MAELEYAVNFANGPQAMPVLNRTAAFCMIVITRFRIARLREQVAVKSGRIPSATTPPQILPAHARLPAPTAIHYRTKAPASGSAQSAFTKRICSTVAQFVCSSRGEAKTRLRPLPLLTATLRRSRDNRKSSPREVSSEDEAVMETSATGASCPWNLSTVPTRIVGRASESAFTCALYGATTMMSLSQTGRLRPSRSVQAPASSLSMVSRTASTSSGQICARPS